MAAQTRTFFVFSTFGPDKPVSTVKKKRNGEGRGGFSRGKTVQRSPREKRRSLKEVVRC